jgi:hypothetical protein
MNDPRRRYGSVEKKLRVLDPLAHRDASLTDSSRISTIANVACGEVRPKLLSVAPHPDDEVLGAPATTLLLRDLGWDVVVFACSLGRPGQQQRRLAEMRRASDVAGWDLHVSDPLLELSSAAADPEPNEQLTRILIDAVRQIRPSVTLSPHPQDGHPTHELVGRSVGAALQATAVCERWWQWGLWTDLPLPTAYVPYGELRLMELLEIAGAHEQEIARNNYLNLLRGRALTASVLGSERVFGFGSHAASTDPFAELLTELVLQDGWRLGTARVLSSASPLMPPTAESADWLVDAPSWRKRRFSTATPPDEH